MAKKFDFHWYVLNWNINKDILEKYDVGDYFIRSYKSIKPKNRPSTREDVNEFLRNEARHEFWARCEYEIITHAWPMFKNEQKIDIYEQLVLNWDAFVDKFCGAIGI